MLCKGIYKPPQGKLIKVAIETKDRKTIGWIRITGDFFVYPETSIEIIENALAGKEINEKLAELIGKIVEENSIEMFGIDSKAIFEAIKIAVGGEK